MIRSTLVLTSILLVAPLANADDLPKGTSDAKPASKGSTDVTTGKFEAASPVEESKDATELAISAGGVSTGGNSRSFAATANLAFRVRREQNQFTLLLAGNYARAKVADAPVQTTVENEQARARFDRFVSNHVVLFLGVQALRDRFRGLDLRTQVDPGVGYYFVNEKKVLFWVEGGYDFLYDVRRDDARTVLDDDKKPVLDASGQPVVLDKTKTVHSGRAFVGYSNKVSDGVGLAFGLEYLQALTDTTIYRLNLDMGVTSKIGKGFSLATTYSLKYDHAPLPGKEKIDHITSLALVYTVL
jgi:putative salt-induced outer membrane protein